MIINTSLRILTSAENRRLLQARGCHSGEGYVTAATSQCWSVGKEVAIPLEIRLIVQRVRAPHG
jgi:hypothetical protein